MHKRKKVKIILSNKEHTEVYTKPYVMQIDDVLDARFGVTVIDEFHSTGKLKFNIRTEHLQVDMPQLLELPQNEKINWKEQEYDSMAEVYFFFLSYKQNAWLHQLELKKEMIASDLRMLETIISSMPKNILERLNLKHTQSN